VKSSKAASKSGVGSQLRSYFAALPADSRRELKRVRAAVRSVAPTATEGISYRIPTFKLDGKALVYYAAWKDHIGLYPVTAIIRRTVPQVAGYESKKGTIRFPLDRPVPISLVKRLIKARVSELRSRARK
jgi:uncharacterized protein YdhG (YjbR/CyaY superfamily)